MNGTQTPLQSALAKGGRLTFAAAALWLLLVGPAWSLGGAAGLEGLSIAALLCVVPGWIVFSLCAFAPYLTSPWGGSTDSSNTAGSNVSTNSQGASQTAMLVVLGGTVLRLLFVLAGLMFVRSLRPDLGFREFTVWLLAFYMATLLVETLLVLKPAAGESAEPVRNADAAPVDKPAS